MTNKYDIRELDDFCLPLKEMREIVDRLIDNYGEGTYIYVDSAPYNASVSVSKEHPFDGH